MNFYTRNCSALPFDSMPAMKTDKDGTRVVRCVEFSEMSKKQTVEVNYDN